MTRAIDLLLRHWKIVAFVLYTALVVIATIAATSDSFGLQGELAARLKEAHEEEISRMQALQDRELEERDRILQEYQSEIEVIRNDYWTTINQIESDAHAQREDIVRRIYEDPDAAAQVLTEKYGLVYTP